MCGHYKDILTILVSANIVYQFSKKFEFLQIIFIGAYIDVSFKWLHWNQWANLFLKIWAELSTNVAHRLSQVYVFFCLILKYFLKVTFKFKIRYGIGPWILSEYLCQNWNRKKVIQTYKAIKLLFCTVWVVFEGHHVNYNHLHWVSYVVIPCYCLKVGL